MGQGRIAEVFPWVRNRIWRALLKAKNPDTAIRLLQISIYETDPITDPITGIENSQLRMVRMIRIKTQWQGGFQLTAL